MRIAVLFDGAGFARLGLEQAGHSCTGYELDPAKHHLSKFIGSGNCVLADALTVNLSEYDAVWTSSPCQELSSARTQGAPISPYAVNSLDWCLDLCKKYPDKVIWIENVLPQGPVPDWGIRWNAAQFLRQPVQSRTRLVGGQYKKPLIYRPYRSQYPALNLCPAVTATEYRGCKTDQRRASRYYGRRLTLQEAAYHQGLDQIPPEWFDVPDWYTVPAGRKGSRKTNWTYNLYEAIGNAVPVYMGYAFGIVYSQVEQKINNLNYQQISLF